MLPETIKLEIVTPDRLVLTEGVAEVVLPSAEGYLGVRPGHAPLLCRLDVGEISYRVGGKKRFLSVSGGFAEILQDGVEVLAATCEPAEEIDVQRARAARERAAARLEAKQTDSDFLRAEVSLKKAISRIRAHELGHR